MKKINLTTKQTKTEKSIKENCFLVQSFDILDGKENCRLPNHFLSVNGKKSLTTESGDVKVNYLLLIFSTFLFRHKRTTEKKKQISTFCFILFFLFQSEMLFIFIFCTFVLNTTMNTLWWNERTSEVKNPEMSTSNCHVYFYSSTFRLPLGVDWKISRRINVHLNLRRAEFVTRFTTVKDELL